MPTKAEIAEASGRLLGSWDGSYGVEGIDVRSGKVTGVNVNRRLFYADATLCARVALEVAEAEAIEPNGTDEAAEMRSHRDAVGRQHIVPSLRASRKHRGEEGA